MKELASPSNPIAGYNTLFFKTDDKLYKRTSAGVESVYGSTDLTLHNSAMGESGLAVELTGLYNIAIGFHAAYSQTGITGTVAIGANAARDNLASYCTFVGYQSGMTANANGQTALGYRTCGASGAGVTGTLNTCLGYVSGAYLLAGQYNVLTGMFSGNALTDGSFNTAVGSNALKEEVTGDYNTALGYMALNAQVGVSCNVGIGNSAGKYETLGSKLFIDSFDRTNEAGGRTKSLIYGIFGATVADQRLTFNCGYMGFFGTAAVIKPTACTAQLTTLTHTAPGTPDYAVQDLVNSGGYGFVTKDEGNSVLKVVANLQTRVTEMETRLKALGLFT